MCNQDIATAWRDVMLVDAFRKSRSAPAPQDAAGPSPADEAGDSPQRGRVSDAEVQAAMEAARVEGERVARRQVEREISDIRARAMAELERANALRLKASRLRRSLDAELKKTRRVAHARNERELADARQQSVEILEEARKSAEHIRRTARHAAESEVQALLADLEAARKSHAA